MATSTHHSGFPRAPTRPIRSRHGKLHRLRGLLEGGEAPGASRCQRAVGAHRSAPGATARYTWPTGQPVSHRYGPRHTAGPPHSRGSRWRPGDVLDQLHEGGALLRRAVRGWHELAIARLSSSAGLNGPPSAIDVRAIADFAERHPGAGAVDLPRRREVRRPIALGSPVPARASRRTQHSSVGQEVVDHHQTRAQRLLRKSRPNRGSPRLGAQPRWRSASAGSSRGRRRAAAPTGGLSVCSSIVWEDTGHACGTVLDQRCTW